MSFDKMKAYFMKVSGFDPRSIVLFHVMLLLVVIKDSLSRIPWIPSLYGPDGIMPLRVMAAVCRREQPCVINASIFSAMPSVVGVTCLFLLTAVAAAVLISPFRRWWISVLLIYLLAAMKVRYSYALNGADNQIPWMLIWAAFIPWPTRDELSGPKRATAPRENIFHLFILFHIICFYFFSGAVKEGIPWWEGSALQYVLRFDFMRTSLFDGLLEFPWLTHLLTHTARGLELAGAFLLLVQPRFQKFRLILIGAFWSFHLMMGLTLRTTPLPELGFVTWSLFLPSLFWEKIGFWPRLQALLPDKNPVRPPVLLPLAFVIALISFVAVLGNLPRLQIPPVRDARVWTWKVGLSLSWDFFPHAPETTGVVVTEALTWANQPVFLDLPQGQIVSSAQEFFDDPRNTIYRNRHWAKAFYQVSGLSKGLFPIAGFSNYICRSFDYQVQSFRLVFHRQRIEPDGLKPLAPVTLNTIDCRDQNRSRNGS